MELENFKKIGKAVLVAGVKSVTLTAGVAVLSTVAKSGLEAVKDLSLDKLLK